MTTNPSIREYFNTSNQPRDCSHWTGFRDIPSSLEVFDQGRKEHGEDLQLSENIVVGPYASRDDYLERHYQLLREDAVAPLRDVISELQVHPYIMEKESDNSAYMYEKVGLTGTRAAIHTHASVGLHHWTHFCQCWDSCSGHFLLEKGGQEGQLGAVEASTYRSNCRFNTSKGTIQVNLSRCCHCSAAFG